MIRVWRISTISIGISLIAPVVGFARQAKEPQHCDELRKSQDDSLQVSISQEIFDTPSLDSQQTIPANLESTPPRKSTLFVDSKERGLTFSGTSPPSPK